MKKRMLAMLLCMAMVLSLLPMAALAAEAGQVNTQAVTRYTVLILDISGSMSGTPATAQKQAAIKFCEATLNATGQNYVAIVKLGSSATVGCNFTSDLNTLKTCINSLPANSGTNTNAALVSAGNLLENITSEDGNLIKNIILCSDGLPESGIRTTDGPYTNEYANTAYATAVALKANYTLYTLGFFHSLSGSNLAFGQQFMLDIASDSSKYYEVTDPDDLEFTFGNIADNITENATQEELREAYVNEHINYFQSSYSTDIVPMTSTMGLAYMLEDANDDLSDTFYEGVSLVTANTKMITELLNPTSYFDIDWGSGRKFSFTVPKASVMDMGSSEYSVILYQLMAGDTVYNGILDTFSMNYEKNIRSFAKSLSDNLLNLVKTDIGDEYDVAKSDLMEAAGIIRTADPSSSEFATAYKNFETLGNKYLDLSRTKDYLKNISSVASDAFSFLNATLKELDSIGKAYQYVCWAESYAETRESFKDVLSALSIEAKKQADVLYSLGSPKDRTNPYSKCNMYYGLSNAINSYLETMDKYAEDANAAFVKEVKNSTSDLSVDLIVGFLTNKALGGSTICPELAAINIVLSSNIVLSRGKLLIDLFTSVDDEYKMALTVESLKLISSLMIDISDQYGQALLDEEVLDTSTIPNQLVPVDPETRFVIALRFDESIRLYKNAMLLACDYGIKYEESRLSYASAMAGSFPDSWYDLGFTTPWQKQASTSSLAISLLSFQKSGLSDIHCHNDGLNYDNATGLITYSKSCKIISIACPVDVTVLAPDGSQLACLTNGSATVASGYEPYFFVCPLNEKVNDFVKVAVIPDDENYQILINGTGSGPMTVFVGRYDGSDITDITELKTFANFYVTDDTTGYLDFSDKENSLGYLVLNGETYGETESSERIITFDPNGGSCSTVIMATDTNGKLSTLPFASRSGYIFNGWFTSQVGGNRVTPNTVLTEDITLYAQWTRIGGNGTSDNSSYTISTPSQILGGSIKVQPTSAKEGTNITITATPDTGYQLDKLTVTDKNGSEIKLTDQDDGTYTFTMPDSEVFVTVSFTELELPALVLPFTDVTASDWFYDAVAYVYDNSLMTGTSATTFSPNATTTRGMIVTILHRLEGSPAAAASGFADVESGAWYQEAVDWAAANGIVNGTSETTFAPTSPITREQMAAILYRYAAYKGYDVSQLADLSRFSDSSAVNTYAADALAWANAAGLITGVTDTTLSPQGSAVRAQAATILMRFCENIAQ